MEATVVASSYSGSFCELNCPVVLLLSHHQLPAASWLSLTLGQSVLPYKEVWSLNAAPSWRFTAFHTCKNCSQPSNWLTTVISLKKGSKRLSLLHSFLSDEQLCSDHFFAKKITVVTVTRRSQTVSRHCARRATIFTKEKFPVSRHSGDVLRQDLQERESLGT